MTTPDETRPGNPRRGLTLDRLEWLFPLSGRWLRYFLATVGSVAALLALLYALRLAEMLPRLASAQHIGAQWRLSLPVGEDTGPWTARGTILRQNLGPVQLSFAYPVRGRRSPREPLIYLALQAIVLITPWFIAKRVLRGARGGGFTIAYVVAACVLLFPFATACGPMGCLNIQLWHIVWLGVLGQR
jgi:hypothetical protein